MPRPAVLDDLRRAEVLALASHGFSRQAIADFADCDLEVIEQAAQRDPAFGQQLRLARSKFVCRNIEVIQRHAAMSPKHSTWLLERLDPEKFARRSPYSITPAQLHRHFQTWTKAMIAAVPPEARVAVAQTASLLAATHLPLILHADASDAPADDGTNLPSADDVTSANDLADGAPAVPPTAVQPTAVQPTTSPPNPLRTPHSALPASSAPTTSPPPSLPTPNSALPASSPPTTSPPSPLPTPRSALPVSTASILHSTYMNLLSALLLVGLVGAHAPSPAIHAPSPVATVVIERDPPHVMPSALKNPCQAPDGAASSVVPAFGRAGLAGRASSASRTGHPSRNATNFACQCSSIPGQSPGITAGCPWSAGFIANLAAAESEQNPPDVTPSALNNPLNSPGPTGVRSSHAGGPAHRRS
jgi:hypothetical protein